MQRQGDVGLVIFLVGVFFFFEMLFVKFSPESLLFYFFLIYLGLIVKVSLQTMADFDSLEPTVSLDSLWEEVGFLFSLVYFEPQDLED